MIQVKIKSPAKTFVRDIPQSWGDLIESEKRKALNWMLKLGADKGRAMFLKSYLKLPRWVYFFIDTEDWADLLTQVAFLNLEPITAPIFGQFLHRDEVYYLPKAEFTNGSAGEWALALDFYNEFGESKDINDLLKLVAVLARENRQNEADTIRYGDVRVLIHDNSDEVETRAEKLEGLDPAIIMSVLRYFEGIKMLIHDLGVQSDLWDNPAKDAGKTNKLNKQDSVAIFGWRTIYRSLAESVSEYDVIFQRKFWEIFSIMKEKKVATDAMEAKYKSLTNGSSQKNG